MGCKYTNDKASPYHTCLFDGLLVLRNFARPKLVYVSRLYGENVAKNTCLLKSQIMDWPERKIKHKKQIYSFIFLNKYIPL